MHTILCLYFVHMICTYFYTHCISYHGDKYHHIISSLVANSYILSSKAMIFQTFLWTNLLLALASSMLCVYWMPSAAGSGLPEVKAYLNGVRSMQRIANWSMLVVKILGTILSVSCLLAVGQGK